MKMKRILAGISALAMAASASCMVSAEEITEVTSDTAATDVVTAAPEKDSQVKHQEGAQKHENAEAAEKPEAAEGEDVVKPERPGRPEGCDGENCTNPEKPEKQEGCDGENCTNPEKPGRPAAEEGEDAVKPQRPERPAAEDGEDVVKPQRPDGCKDEKPETEEGEEAEKPETEEGKDVVKPERPGKGEIDKIDVHKEKQEGKLKEYTEIDFSKFTDGTVFGKGYFELCKKLGLGFNWDAEVNFTPAVDEEGTFTGFTGLVNFNVDLENKNFKSVDGVLFDKDMKILISYPDSKTDEEYTVPEGVEAIADFAFDNCKNLNKINLPKTLRKIGKSAFKNVSITGIEIPENVKKIEEGAFEGNEKLEKVKLPGGLKVIEKDAFKGNKKLKDVNVPKKIENIKKGAFDDCTSVDELVKQAIEKYCDIVYGDVSKDQVTDLTDLVMMSLKLLDGKSFDEIQDIAGDVVDDDVIDIADLATLKQVIMGENLELGPKD